MNISIEVSDDGIEYLTACARIRKISRRALIRRLYDMIVQDQMVSSVLDDADDMLVRRKGEHRYRAGAAV